MFDKITGVIVISIIALIGAVTAATTQWAAPLKNGFSDGGTQLAWEGKVDEALVVRDSSISLWGAALYGVFGQTSNGAVSGQDNWLFTAEEYEQAPDFNARLTGALDEITSTVATLEGAGSTVILAIIPDKARIMDDKLSRNRPDLVQARYDLALAGLKDRGVAATDLRAAFNGLNKPFMARDTHWTPEGAQAVAKALAPEITNATFSRKSFVLTTGAETAHQGDLLSFVKAEPFSETLGLTAEPVIQYQVAASGDGGGLDALFGDSTVPATLIGTSYSAIEAWNFVGFLMLESETDILNRAEEGQGPFLPMRKYLEEIAAGEPAPEIVIWEIPERYLTVEPAPLG